MVQSYHLEFAPTFTLAVAVSVPILVSAIGMAWWLWRRRR